MLTWAPVVAAIVAAAAALLGYWLTGRSKQLDAKAKAYADALAAIEAYKSLPYRIMRCTIDLKDQVDLLHRVSDVEQQIAFYRRWLALESARVGLAYEALANKVMQHGAKNRDVAWQMQKRAWHEKEKAGVAAYEAFAFGFEYEDQFEQGVCLAAMRQDLGRRRRVPANALRRLPFVGSSFSLQDSEGNTYRMTLVEVLDPAQVGDLHIRPINGDRSVGAVFEIKALNGNLRLGYPIEYATLIGSNGQTYKAYSILIAGYKNSFDVSRGDSVKGTIVFQVPSNVKPSKVQWNPDDGFGSAFQWNVL